MSEDLIRRSDAIDVLYQYQESVEMGIKSFPLAVKAMNDIPSADIPQKVVAQITFNEEKLREIVKKAVERFKEEYEITDRPEGEWIDEHEDGHGSWVGTCNQCGKENHMDNFCPFCGAKMKGADDE